MPAAAALAPSGAPVAAAPLRLRRRDRAAINRAAWRRDRRRWHTLVLPLARALLEARQQRPTLTAQEWLADH